MKDSYVFSCKVSRQQECELKCVFAIVVSENHVFVMCFHVVVCNRCVRKACACMWWLPSLGRKRVLLSLRPYVEHDKCDKNDENYEQDDDE